MNGLDLFSGIGGIALALEPWVKPIAYCENDRHAQAVLMSRMAGGELYQAPIWDDVRTLRGSDLPEVDIISGGFPCQDISAAGRGIGLGGSRSQLFFEIIRLAGEIRPRFVFLENVPALAVRGLDRVLLEFAALRYDCRWTIVSAGEMGAPHLRERIWILAYAHGIRSWNERETLESENGEMGHRPTPLSFDDGDEGDATYAHRLRGWKRWRFKDIRERKSHSEWDFRRSPEPTIRRMDARIPDRVDRLHALGNSVCPQAAREAFVRLSGIGG